MRGKAISIILCTAWLALGVGAHLALADGGTVQFSERRGDYQFTVFTAPTPPRVGPVNVSVLVQTADSTAPPPDPSIIIRAYPLAHPHAGITAPATMEAATNKLLRAARLEFTESGPWHVEVELQGTSATPQIGFDLDIGPPPPPWLDLSPWILWPLLPIGLFAAHQLLDHRRRVASARQAPLVVPNPPRLAGRQP